MQESLMSLMQMSKTSAALKRLSDAGLPYISVLTDQTFGGVSASLAMLGDINIGEPTPELDLLGDESLSRRFAKNFQMNFSEASFYWNMAR